MAPVPTPPMMPRRPDSVQSSVAYIRGTPSIASSPVPKGPEEIRRACVRALGYSELPQSAENDRQEVKDLVYEHWNRIKKVRKNLDLCTNGYVPAASFCKSVVQELALRRDKDARVLADIVLDCVVDSSNFEPHPLAKNSEGLVDIEALWKLIQRPKKGLEWKKRFRAAGVVPVSLQRHTTGIDQNPRRTSTGPPYAVCGDGDHMKCLIKEYFLHRCRLMRDCLQRHGPLSRQGMLTTEEFRKAMFTIEKHGTNNREIDALIEVVDPRNTGFVNITDFLDKFGLEYLKGRSMRISVGRDNNDGDSHTLQWPSSTQPEYKRTALMEKLRCKQLRTKKVASSRSSTLRKKFGKSQRENLKLYDQSFSEISREKRAENTISPTEKPKPHPKKIKWCYITPSATHLGNVSSGPSNYNLGGKHFKARCLRPHPPSSQSEEFPAAPSNLAEENSAAVVC